MRQILPKKLLELAFDAPVTLYVVGGSVRDHLLSLTPKDGKRDLDICAPLAGEAFAELAKRHGFTVQAVYRATNTVKLKDGDGQDYEYSPFRSDKYVRGVHVPVETVFTDDVTLDARRRDFTVNAIYYDIRNDRYEDPLGGIPALKDKRLTTVAPSQKVFGEDGLRLLRLARQAAQLGFHPDEECFAGAKHNAALIRDITPERVFTELTAILAADEKYGVADGHYHGLTLLDQTRVLDHILPELTAGRGMKQRADFHDHDVLEHSLRAARYAPRPLRLAALLHDVGKPFCELRDGTSYAHPEEGARLAGEILSRWKAPKKLTAQVQTLTALHMYDLDGKVGENKLRRFFAAHADILEELMQIKQADFSACKDDPSTAPTVVKWRALLEKLRAERAPLRVKELAVTGKDLLDIGLPAPTLSEVLEKLLAHAVCNPKDNQKERLVKIALGMTRSS